MTIRYRPATRDTSEIYDSDTNATLEIVPLPELRAKLTRWREHARAVNAETRRDLGLTLAPTTVTYRHYRRRLWND